MGWADCGTDSRGRSIGYAFEGRCDHRGCRASIARGVANACGGMHGNGAMGGDSRVDWDSMAVACEGYFCGKHLVFADLEHEDGADLYAPQLCPKCAAALEVAYRTDPDWREHWPSKTPPFNAARIETGTDETAQQAQPRRGESRKCPPKL